MSSYSTDMANTRPSLFRGIRRGHHRGLEGPNIWSFCAGLSIFHTCLCIQMEVSHCCQPGASQICVMFFADALADHNVSNHDLPSSRLGQCHEVTSTDPDWPFSDSYPSDVLWAVPGHWMSELKSVCPISSIYHHLHLYSGSKFGLAPVEVPQQAH